MKPSAWIARASGLMGILCFANLANSAVPRISYIIINKTNNVRWAEIHFPTEANRAYVLQGVNSLSCVTPGSCNAVPAGNWINLHSYFSSPFTNHFIYRDTLTNKTRFYRLRATP